MKTAVLGMFLFKGEYLNLKISDDTRCLRKLYFDSGDDQATSSAVIQ